MSSRNFEKFLPNDDEKNFVPSFYSSHPHKFSVSVRLIECLIFSHQTQEQVKQQHEKKKFFSATDLRDLQKKKNSRENLNLTLSNKIHVGGWQGLLFLRKVGNWMKFHHSAISIDNLFLILMFKCNSKVWLWSLFIIKFHLLILAEILSSTFHIENDLKS